MKLESLCSCSENAVKSAAIPATVLRASWFCATFCVSDPAFAAAPTLPAILKKGMKPVRNCYAPSTIPPANVWLCAA